MTPDYSKLADELETNAIFGGASAIIQTEVVRKVAAALRLAAQAQKWKKDAERMNWLEQVMFDKHWDGTIGRSPYWHMAGPYRHELAKMRGTTLREAIDAALAAEEKKP